MRRIAAILLLGCLCLSLSGCGSAQKEAAGSGETGQNTEQEAADSGETGQNTDRRPPAAGKLVKIQNRTPQGSRCERKISSGTGQEMCFYPLIPTIHGL